MLLDIRVVRTDDPLIAQIGASAARRGDELVVLVADVLSARERTEAVLELLTAAERLEFAKVALLA